MAIEINQLCRWTEDPDGFWETDCGNAHAFNDGGPDENQFRFCPYCGKTLVHNPLEIPEE